MITAIGENHQIKYIHDIYIKGGSYSVDNLVLVSPIFPQISDRIKPHTLPSVFPLIRLYLNTSCKCIN